MKRFFTLMLTMAALSAAAQNSLKVEAPSVVTSDETFRVVFTADGKMTDFTWNGSPDFDIVWGPQQGSMSSVNIINGKRTSTHQETVTYLLQPKKQGNFKIAGATAMVEKQECTSSDFSIEVVSSEHQTDESNSVDQGGNTGQSQSQSQTIQSTGTVSDKEIFLKLSLSKTNVVKGEPITAVLKLYTRTDLSGIEDVKFPSFNGFWSKETASVQNLEFNRENVNGVIYNAALLRKYMLIPQQSGTITIEPAEMVCQVRMRTTSGGRSIFDDFFDSYQTIRKRIITPEINVKVRELPAGAPATFAGGVGNFKIQAQLSKTDLKANEAASLTVTVSGTGNISMLETPVIDFPSDFEVYDTRTTEKISNDGTNGQKSFEFPFIPRSHGDFVIPSIKYTYYDSANGKYETLSTGDISVSVEKGEDVDNGGGLIQGVTKQGVRNLAEDIRFIALGNGNFKEKGKFFTSSPLFYGILALILILSFIIDKMIGSIEKRKADIAGTKNRKANKMAKGRLKLASEYLTKGLSTAYYEELHKALLGYLSDKLIIPAAELSKDVISEKLRECNVSQKSIEEIVTIIDKCEYARYSPENQKVQMENEYNEALRSISQIESEMKSRKNGSAKKIAAGLLILCLSTSLSANDNIDGLWSAGNDSFGEQDWQTALNSYKAIESQGYESAELYYNIGNTLFKLDDIPHAILYFEKAIKIDPSYKDAKNNLTIARSMTLDKIEELPQFILFAKIRQLRQTLSADQWAWITVILFAVTALLLLIFRHSDSRQWERISFILACVTLAMTISSFLMSIYGKQAILKAETAIVISPVSSVKSSPSENGKSIFVLHEGTKIKLMDEVGGWNKIELADGRQGWINSNTLEII